MIVESDYLIWNRKFDGDSIEVNGSNCYAIQPVLRETDGKILFCFDRQLILDMTSEQRTNDEVIRRDRQYDMPSSSKRLKAKPSHTAVKRYLCYVYMSEIKKK